MPIIIINIVSQKKFAKLVTGILSLVASLFFETWNPIPVTNFANFFWLTILIIIIGNFICYNLYGLLLKRYTATFLSFAGFSIPLFTVLLQCIFFASGITLDFFISAFFASLGLFVFYQEELRHGITKS